MALFNDLFFVGCGVLLSCLIGVFVRGTLWGCFECVGVFWRAGTLFVFGVGVWLSVWFRLSVGLNLL